MAGLTQAQLDEFHDQGYVVADNVLNPERDLEPVMAEYGEVLDGIAHALHGEGVISSPYADLPFEQRLIHVCDESRQLFNQPFDISLPQNAAGADAPMHTGEAVFKLLVNPRLLDCVESIMGPEILSNPIQHVRMKLPLRAVHTEGSSGLAGPTPWHQDNGVVVEEADETEMLTVWLPLNDATIENSCLHVVPYSHRDGIAVHCPGVGGLRIPEKVMDKKNAVPLPMQAGSVLFMHRRTMHCSFDNKTDDEVRWSFDLRYQPAGQPSGRPLFPDFVARSHAKPESELHDPAAWAQLWEDTRVRLAVAAKQKFNRWSADHPGCA
jgi:hypothetical protein